MYKIGENIFLYSKELMLPYLMIFRYNRIEEIITPILPTTLMARVMFTFSLHVKKHATISSRMINS